MHGLKWPMNSTLIVYMHSTDPAAGTQHCRANRHARRVNLAQWCVSASGTGGRGSGAAGDERWSRLGPTARHGMVAEEVLQAAGVVVHVLVAVRGGEVRSIPQVIGAPILDTRRSKQQQMERGRSRQGELTCIAPTRTNGSDPDRSVLLASSSATVTRGSHAECAKRFFSVGRVGSALAAQLSPWSLASPLHGFAAKWPHFRLWPDHP